MVPDNDEVEKLMKRCQRGCGGRNAIDDAHDILADCYGTLGALDSEVRRLRNALKDIAQLGSHYAQTPPSIYIARKALGCKKMPYED